MVGVGYPEGEVGNYKVGGDEQFDVTQGPILPMCESPHNATMKSRMLMRNGILNFDDAGLIIIFCPLSQIYTHTRPSEVPALSNLSWNTVIILSPSLRG